MKILLLPVRNFNPLAACILSGSIIKLLSELVRNPKDRVSHDVANTTMLLLDGNRKNYDRFSISG